jgi:flagellar basal-body rod protein FlgB
MSSIPTDIFSLAEKRLAWAGERQTLLARNIANLDTPGFQALDSRDFRRMLSGAAGVQPVRTAPNHLTGTVDPGMTSRPERGLAARTADKNGVSLEEQLMKVADTESIHSTVTAIYKKYATMFTAALGRAS